VAGSSAPARLRSQGRGAGGRPVHGRGNRILSARFFDRSVHEVARDLIGCVLFHGRTGGVIVEAESYHQDDPACHGFNGATERNSVLFGGPGRAYVYRSYGVHSCLNFVTAPDGVAAAVLIRALEPFNGIGLMRRRRGVERIEDLCSGPGKLTQALGIGLGLNGSSLAHGPVGVLARSGAWRRPEIVEGPRVGISKGTDLPWRFCAANSRCVSRPWPPRGDAARRSRVSSD
jgi:DNA-3-methyladenine glycosylase